MAEGLRLLPRSRPLRLFAVANLVNTVGSGLFVTAGALYFTQVIGLSLGQVGVGLSVTIAGALLTIVPLGRLADRVGAKRVYLALLLLQAIAMTGYLFVDTYPTFLIVAAVSAVADRGISAVVGALIHDLAAVGNRVATRAYLRAVTNTGFALGSLLAGLALQIGTAPAYRSVVAGNALMFLAAAALVALVPASRRSAGGTQRPSRPASALRDRPFLLVSAANAALTIHFELLSFALPLWVVLRTDAPPWAVSGVFVVNTALVVLLQVRVSASAREVLGATRQVRVAGGLLVASCLTMALTARSTGTYTVALLLGWAAVYSVAELLHASAEFSFSFELADDAAQGEYQSVFAMARGMVRAAAPAVLSLVVMQPSGVGWLVAGSFLLLASLVTARLAASAWQARVRTTLEAVSV